MPEQFTPTAPRRPNKYETHMYYQRPTEGPRGEVVQNPGWITVGGVKGDKRTRYEDWKRFTALRQFGEIPSGHSNQWEHILCQPGGPEAFPVDQVLTLRWYNPQEIPMDCAWMGRDEEPCPYMMKLRSEGVRFPQLEGHEVIERQCPECERAKFATVDGVGGVGALARHLSIIHDWTPERLKKYGEAMGIDFDAVYSRKTQEKTFSFKPEHARNGVACDECDWEPDATSDGSPLRQLQGHKMGAHKKEPVTA